MQVIKEHCKRKESSHLEQRPWEEDVVNINRDKVIGCVDPTDGLDEKDEKIVERISEKIDCTGTSSTYSNVDAYADIMNGVWGPAGISDAGAGGAGGAGGNGEVCVAGDGDRGCISDTCSDTCGLSCTHSMMKELPPPTGEKLQLDLEGKIFWVEKEGLFCHGYICVEDFNTDSCKCQVCSKVYTAEQIEKAKMSARTRKNFKDIKREISTYSGLKYADKTIEDDKEKYNFSAMFNNLFTS